MKRKSKAKSSKKTKRLLEVRDLMSNKDAKGGWGDVKGESLDRPHPPTP